MILFLKSTRKMIYTQPLQSTRTQESEILSLLLFQKSTFLGSFPIDISNELSQGIAPHGGHHTILYSVHNGLGKWLVCSSSGEGAEL